MTAAPDRALGTPLWRVVFPRRWALAGALVSCLFAGELAAWTLGALRAGDEPPWLALPLGVAMVAGLLMSLRQLVAPTWQAEVGSRGLRIRRRGDAVIAWDEIVGIDYREHEEAGSGPGVRGRVRHKVVRLRLGAGHTAPPEARLFRDDADVIHLDAFAASPGGRDLAARLEAVRRDPRGTAPGPPTDA